MNHARTELRAYFAFGVVLVKLAKASGHPIGGGAGKVVDGNTDHFAPVQIAGALAHSLAANEPHLDVGVVVSAPVKRGDTCESR